MGIFKRRRTSEWHPLPQERFPERISFDYVKQILGRSDDFNSKLLFIKNVAVL